MKRKATSGIMLTMLLVSMLTLALNTEPVKASGTIYIRADGSIYPPTAPISSVDNITYTFTDNIYDSVVVERNNIVVDGAGYTVQGTGAFPTRGIDLSARNNVTVKNTNIRSFTSGIFLQSSQNNVLTANNATNSQYGIYLSTSSSGNNVTGNSAQDNTQYGIILWSCSGNFISGNKVEHNGGTGGWGIALGYSSSNSIAGNIVKNNPIGLYLVHSSTTNNNLYENMIKSSSLYGIIISEGASYNKFYHNNVIGNSVQAYVGADCVGNAWSDTYPSGGNYWSDYTGTDANRDGMGDTPYVINANNKDSYPLVRAWGSVRNLNTNRIYLTIQSAIDAPQTLSGHTIFVRNGTYYENVVINKRLSLVGENRTNTIIDAGGTGIVIGVTVNNVNITGFTVQNSGYYDQGVRVYSSGNSIIGNIITGNGDGVYLDSSSSNIVYQNNITENGVGIALYESASNNFTRNNVVDNYWGVYLETPASNIFYHNNFIGNIQQVYIFDSRLNIWDDGYPSAGNYWSDYPGKDEKSGQGQNLPGSDGIGDTAYIFDGNNQDGYPLMTPWQLLSDVSVTDIAILDTVVTQKYPVYINVTIENQGGHPELVYIDVSANNVVVSTVYTVVGPCSSRSLGATWNTLGFKGVYTISAYVRPVQGETDIADNGLEGGVVKVVGKGYFIIVAGGRSRQPPLDDQAAINLGCSEVFRTLRAVGYGGDEIYYINQWTQDVDGDGINDVDDSPSNTTKIQYAIANWASSRVTSIDPLFIYMFDHGGDDLFAVDMSNGDYLSASTLASWLDSLEAKTRAPIYIIYAACCSGSFVDDLSETGRMIVTSCRPEESSYYSPGNFWEAFSQPFWGQIKSGLSIASSFNYACDVIQWYSLPGPQTPLLDDDGDGNGNTGQLPNGGDGLLAENIRIGACEWPFPWISYTVARQFFQWPPPPTVTLWAKIENKTSLVHVRAAIVPPDWTPPALDGELVPIELEYFEMTDSNHDGNFTVDIPETYFLDHASGPSEFRFIISAEEENESTATPLVTCVEFTETGLPSSDAVPPHVFIQRPCEGQVVQNVITINGTAMDDVCLKSIEFYLNNELLGTINLLPTSNSLFEFNVDTTTMPNGPLAIIAKIFDTSSNNANQTLNILVNNYVHDMAVTDIKFSRTIVGQGFTINATITVANHGSYTETFNLTIYANSTFIESRTVSLSYEDFTSFTLTWNTSGFVKDNYIISAYATPVSGETDTADNTLIGGTVLVTVPGEVNGDKVVNVYDIFALGRAYASTAGSSNWNPNTDIDGDGTVETSDIAIASNHFGQSW